MEYDRALLMREDRGHYGTSYRGCWPLFENHLYKSGTIAIYYATAKAD